jgi:hypothetical protein
MVFALIFSLVSLLTPVSLGLFLVRWATGKQHMLCKPLSLLGAIVLISGAVCAALRFAVWMVSPIVTIQMPQFNLDYVVGLAMFPFLLLATWEENNGLFLFQSTLVLFRIPWPKEIVLFGFLVGAGFSVYAKLSTAKRQWLRATIKHAVRQSPHRKTIVYAVTLLENAALFVAHHSAIPYALLPVNQAMKDMDPVPPTRFEIQWLPVEKPLIVNPAEAPVEESLPAVAPVEEPLSAPVIVPEMPRRRKILVEAPPTFSEEDPMEKHKVLWGSTKEEKQAKWKWSGIPGKDYVDLYVSARDEARLQQLAWRERKEDHIRKVTAFYGTLKPAAVSRPRTGLHKHVHQRAFKAYMQRVDALSATDAGGGADEEMGDANGMEVDAENGEQ